MVVLRLYFKSLRKHYWALMSCAVFTFIGVVVLWFNKTIRWALGATFTAAVGMLLVASFLAWLDQHHKVIEASSTIDHLTSHADITGQILGSTIVENPLGETGEGIINTRVIVTAVMVNKSPLVAPTIMNFLCEMSLEDGETLRIPYEMDFGNDYNTTHRDEFGRQIGPWPSLGYFNHTGMVNRSRTTT